MRKILQIFVTWRLLLILAVFAGEYFISLRLGYFYHNPWANFDGVHYLSIAQNGYISEAVFFPFFPLLIKLFSLFTGGNYVISGLAVSNLAFVFAMYFLYKLLQFDFDKKQSFEVLLLLLVFPTAFFFGAVYSESIFLLLLVLSFYLARKNMWFWAVVAAFLLCVTRIVGIFVVPALLFEYYQQKKTFNVGLLLAPLGLLGYAVFNYFKWGDFLYFVHAHGELNNGRSVENIILFPQTLYRYLKILTSLPVSQFEWRIALLEILVFCFSLSLLYVGWRKKIRASYLVFAILAFLFSTQSGTFSGLPRYILILFPVFISLTYLPKKYKYVYVVLSTTLLLFLTAYFSRGYFVA